jgi:toxin-antitoxin system PIN domain toxin
VIAVDTNVLVYAHRPEFPFHGEAKALLAGFAGSPRPWGLVLHCLVEFAGVVSHPRRFLQPSSPAQVVDQIHAWRESPSAVLLADGPAVLDQFLEQIAIGRIDGLRVHDARIAATCIASGVDELLTCDRDYGRFPALRTRNPFVG